MWEMISIFMFIQDEKYIKYVDSLTHMLQRYNKLIASLDHAEVSKTRILKFFP